MYLVIAMWRPKPEWLALTAEERQAFLTTMGDQLAELNSAGIELVGNGSVDPAAGDATWTHYAVWRALSLVGAKKFAADAENSGVPTYFERIQLAGPMLDMQELAASMIALPATLDT
ncbi:DUF6616 family protein [Streptomyces sp. NPDC006527]|uniref:DUF6616 family protein n=1 Tax=Streptomyces sp. NPDC006527 TaxID=3364749 RepID=UPI0036C33F2D